jgi:hypothetical protein
MDNEEVKQPGSAENAPESSPVQNLASRLKQPTRKIIIETDGNGVAITTNETVGALELISILQILLQSMSQR